MALREIFARFGFEFDSAKLKQAHAGVESVKKEAKAAGGPAGLGAFAAGLKGALALAVGNELVQFGRDIAAQAAELKDASEQTGLATDELQAYSLAAELGGASAGDFANALKKLSKELATGTDESGQQSKLFKQLHIDTKNAEGGVRSFSEVLPDIAQKIADLPTPAQQTALALQVFGKAGTKLLPILKQGAAGIAQLKGNLDELGGGFSEEAINRADEYDDSIIKLEYSFRSLKSLLVTAVAPILTTVVDTVRKGVSFVASFNKSTTAASTAVGVLAAVLSGKLALALAPFLLPGLKFLAIFLAVDDVIAFLRGKDSVIGAILKGWFGDDAVNDIRSAFNSIGDIAGGTIGGIRALWGMLFAENEAEQDQWTAKFFSSTEKLNAALDNFFNYCGLIFGNVTASFFGMITSLEVSWNQWVFSISQGIARVSSAAANAFKDTLGVDTKGAYSRQQNAEAALGILRDNIETNKDKLSNGGNAINYGKVSQGPVREGVATTNYVEVNPAVNVVLPPGVSGTAARELSRQAVAGATAGSLKPTLQSLENRG